MKSFFSRFFSLLFVLVFTSILFIQCSHKPTSKAITEVKTPETKPSNEALARELQDEINIGREVAAKLMGTYGDLNERKKSLEYLNLLAQTLAIKVGRPEIQYFVGILDSSEINAFATPGGYILLTSGLLNFVENEHELAGVMAHEMGHINHKHLFKEVAPKREVTAGETLSRFLSRGGANVTFAFAQAVNRGLKTLLDEGLKPELEFEADQSGIEYTLATGYDPRYFKSFMTRLAAKKQEETKVLLKTHPSFETRIQKLNVGLTSLGLNDVLNPLDNPLMVKRFAVLAEKK